MSTGNLPESLSQAILVGIVLVGRLGVNVLSCMFDGDRHLSKINKLRGGHVYQGHIYPPPSEFLRPMQNVYIDKAQQGHINLQ